MIDFGRAIQTAWDRMVIILFQPFDFAKWGLIGFNAFLVTLAEGGVNVNNPFPSGSNQKTTYEYSTTTQALHAFKQLTTWLSDLPNNPWFKIFICLAAAYLVIWLVLNWVGCRAEFVFLDNIVRNRAALAWPWQRYAHQGNIWFVFHLGLILVSGLFFVAVGGLFVFLNWTWINAARDPAGGEIATLVLTILVSIAVGLVGAVILFLVRSMVLPLYFKQTMGLGAALLAVMTLVFTRPISMFIYLLLSFAIAIISGFIACFIFIAAFCATLSLVCWVSCFPFIGSMLLAMVLCQLILPILVFTRCFQLGVLEQFGPQYDVFTVDMPQVPPTRI